ncbi:MAG: PAS domain-containing protein [Planctomycetota bacterium]|nr:MAG: PAS domain-containing protein [Planctomycetota bacterium]
MNERSPQPETCGPGSPHRNESPPLEGVDHALLETALSGLCVGLVLTDAAERVLWLNRTAERILDVRAADCLHRPFERVIKDVRLAALWQQCRDAQENVLADVELSVPRELALKVNASRCLSASGELIGRAMLFCDVTTERVVQIQLSQDVAQRLLALTSGHVAKREGPPLTHQEIRVLQLVGQGLGNKEIAEKLFVAPSTVRSHLKTLYRKLNLKSRAEAVSYAVRNHLV